MSNTLKIATAAALIAAGIASPSFAQSADHTGSQLPHYYDTTGKQVWGSWAPQVVTSRGHSTARRSGLNAFARVPDATFGSRSPLAAGGGSVGYNENLRTDQW